MTTTVQIDLNCRIPGGTFAGLEDCDGPVEVGDVVHVHAEETDLWGGGLVTGVDEVNRLVYLSVAWGTLSNAYSRRPSPALLEELRARMEENLAARDATLG